VIATVSRPATNVGPAARMPSCRRSRPCADTRPRIGIVDLCVGASGISRYVTDLLHGIDREEFAVTLFCRHDGPYADADLPDVRVVRTSTGRTRFGEREQVATPGRTRGGWVRAGTRRLWRGMVPKTAKHLVGFLQEARAMRQFLLANPVDVLHIQVVSNSYAAVAGRMARVPKIIGTYHLDPGRCRVDALLPEFLTTRCLDYGMAVSESTRDAWASRPGVRHSRLGVIYNGVDVARYDRRSSRPEARRALNLPADASPVVAVVGRLEEQKGHRYLFDAVASLHRSFPKMHLLLAGDGALRPELESRARALGIGQRVSFLGHCNDVQRVLDAADLFVLPSLWEALPFALLEAMASGLPVVATRVAGVPEVVSHGRTGLLVPPADAGALASALAEVVASRSRLDDMGAAARAVVEARYSLGAMLRDTQDAYRAAFVGDGVVQGRGVID